MRPQHKTEKSMSSWCLKQKSPVKPLTFCQGLLCNLFPKLVLFHSHADTCEMFTFIRRRFPQVILLRYSICKHSISRVLFYLLNGHPALMMLFHTSKQIINHLEETEKDFTEMFSCSCRGTDPPKDASPKTSCE